MGDVKCFVLLSFKPLKLKKRAFCCFQRAFKKELSKKKAATILIEESYSGLGFLQDFAVQVMPSVLCSPSSSP
jgi:hypothetical protein